jgi:hypothetical protein
MANKFFGEVGYAENAVESAPGVWTTPITEKQYYGDIERNSATIQAQQVINDGLSLGNSISIVADAYANENFSAIRYVRWMGALWSVTAIEVRSPRLVLRLGGVYNGPTAT